MQQVVVFETDIRLFRKLDEVDDILNVGKVL